MLPSRGAARALLTIVCSLAVVAVDAPISDGATLVRAGATDVGSLQPPIVWKKIPFGSKRKRQMAAYSKRHYGKRSYVLDDPKVIVEHYTDGNSFESAWNYFAANVRHLGEMPGVCSHF